MAPPKYGIYIIQGEISLVVTAMRRTTRWTTHSHQDVDADPLLSCFSQLKDVLNAIADLEDLEPNAFLSPFLDVIRSEDTTGPITGLSLTSVSKFISYGLIDPLDEAAAPAIENIADAVTHARFVGTDPSSDEVVLMKILHVLRTLLLSPAGVLLTNESVCEIMQSCFRICFEMRLSELLRKSAEHTLMDMVQLLFTRLPQFKEDPKWNASMRKLKMRAGGVDPSRMAKKKRSPKCKQSKHRPLGGSQVVHVEQQLADAAALSVESIASSLDQENTEAALSESPCPQVATPEVGKTVIDITNSFQEALDAETDRAAAAGMSGAELVATDNVERTLQREAAADNSELSESIASTQDMQAAENLQKASSETELNSELSCPSEGGDDLESLQSVTDHHNLALVHDTDFINPHGVRFTPQQQGREGSSPLIPYGLPCVRELFRFLVSLINPLDRHNTEVMIHMGLSLLTVALESGADSIRMFKSLLHLVKDEMCKNLFMLLQSERLSLFTATLRVCFLLFESTRSHLKFQLEMYLMKVSDIVISESPKVSYEMREIALESVVHLWRIPGLVTELFLNYDCDLFCSNIFEDLTKLLSKNAFPVSGLFTTHLLSLDALLTVIDTIEQHCHNRILNSTKHTPSSTTGEQGISGSRSAEEKPDSRCMETDTISRPELIETPPMSGYEVGQRLLQSRDLTAVTGSVVHGKEMRKGPQIRPNRMKVTDRVPTSEELSTLKHKKRLYQTGTEQFNLKPSKGIVFLQEQNLLSTPLDPGEVVTFLKENPKLDKRMIGEYLSSKKNAKFLETFVKSFNFEDTRMDEALRLYLETFRLPGEAPVISYIMEQFSEHWHKTNGEPFTNVDAAFTLAYAVIMLNVDQHNHNVKKQNTPMTVEEFKKNLTKTNGGQDFDNDMLEEVYNAIRGEEIVMPAEHTGLVRENYLWKVLLKRGLAKEGLFIHAPTGSFDHELFTLVWGPTVAALSFVFDKSLDEGIIQKAISGFRKCAMISAHYGMSDVFDNLVISLCKFTTLLSSAETPENIPISFGSNSKAQLAARTVFGLAHRHGDILREGWKNILDCLLQLYRAKLVPKSLIEVEDFADAMGKISIMREETTATHRTESGMLSSFYGFFAIDSANQKGPSQEEQEATKQAHNCIRDCHLEQLIMDSKFLREEALQELVKTLIMGSQTPDVQDSLCTQGEEDAAVFFLELLIRVVLQNRDRVSIIWQAIRGHLYSLLVDAGENTFLVERAVVGLLRIAIRLLRREEIASQVLTSLQMLLMMKPNVIHSISQQVAFGLHDLLRTNAANIHSTHDWYTLFTLLEVVGAGANPPAFLHICTSSNMSESAVDTGAQSDSELPSSSVQSESGERGYTSDSELYDSQSKHHRCHTELEAVPNNGGWVMIDKDIASPSQPVRTTHNQYTIDLNEDIHYCDSKALLKSSETLAFLVRDAVHVTPHNFESCIHTIRTFVEASINGGQQRVQPKAVNSKDKKFHHKIGRSKKDSSRLKKSHSTPNHLHVNGSDEDGDNEVLTAGLHSLSIQLLDLMHTLHTRAASIFSYWAEEGGNNSGAADAIDAGTSSLWVKCWCPLLQGIARLCCDSRRQVRSQALTYLQRALLVHDLQTLSAAEWEACFNKVLFPLLTKLLGNINNLDPSGMEETRVRASTLLCKVFLQHLTPLLSLSTFTALWLTILEFMDKYMHAEGSDLLSEAIPESLKNMLLVMHTAGIFQNDCADSQLWKLSWDRIDTFLPHLRDELFKPQEPEPKKIDRNSVGLEKSVSITMEPDVESTIPFDEQTILTGTSLDTSGSSKSSRPGSPLIEESQSPTSAACILHPPLPNVMAKSSSCQVPTPNTILNTTVPLLLNPDIMQGTTIPFFTPQAIEVCAATLLPTPCLFKCLLQLISDSRDTSTLALSASSSIVRRCSPVRVSSHSLSMEQLSIVTENQ